MNGRIRAVALIGTVFGLALATAAASAQDGPQRRQGMPKMFGDDAPKVGETLADVEIFDDQGERIRLRALPGKHKVIVFGCLT